MAEGAFGRDNACGGGACRVAAYLSKRQGVQSHRPQTARHTPRLLRTAEQMDNSHRRVPVGVIGSRRLLVGVEDHAGRHRGRQRGRGLCRAGRCKGHYRRAYDKPAKAI